MARDVGSLLEDVESSLARAGLQPDDLIVVGISGGIDSLTLSHLLANLRDRGAGPRLYAVHVDHGLRPSSARDAIAAKQKMTEMDVPIEVVRVDVNQWGERERRGIEAAAREARYAALASTARRIGAHWIALGHTLNDQAETVLFRLARGTSLEGLAAMREIASRDVPLSSGAETTVEMHFLRPLLRRSRQDIECYASEHGLVPVEDETNIDPRYRRNAIRHQVIPVLESIVPGATSSIARVTELLGDDADLLAALTEDAIQDGTERIETCISVNRARLRQLPVALQRRVIARAVFMLPIYSPSLQPTAERIEAARRGALDGPVSSLIEIGGSISALVDYDRLVIGPAVEIEPVLRRGSGLPMLEPGRSISPRDENVIPLGDRWELSIEVASDVPGWEIRTRQRGDRVDLDQVRAKRLQDWFVDHKVPRYLRDWVPLLVRDGTIRWVIGFFTNDFHDVDSGITARLRERSLEHQG